MADSITPAVEEMEQSLKQIDKVLTSSAKESFLLKKELLGINKILSTKNWEILSRFLSGTGAWRVLNKFKASILAMVQLASIQERAALIEAENMKRIAEVAKERQELIKMETALRKAQTSADEKQIDALREMSDLFAGTELLYGQEKALDMLAERTKKQVSIMTGIIGAIGGKKKGREQANKAMKPHASILESSALGNALLASGFALNAVNLRRLDKDGHITQSILKEQISAYNKKMAQGQDLWKKYMALDPIKDPTTGKVVEKLEELVFLEKAFKGELIDAKGRGADKYIDAQETQKWASTPASPVPHIDFVTDIVRDLEFNVMPVLEKVQAAYRDTTTGVEEDLGLLSTSLEDWLDTTTRVYSGLGEHITDLNYASYLRDKEQLEDHRKILNTINAKYFKEEVIRGKAQAGQKKGPGGDVILSKKIVPRTPEIGGKNIPALEISNKKTAHLIDTKLFGKEIKLFGMKEKLLKVGEAREKQIAKIKRAGKAGMKLKAKTIKKVRVTDYEKQAMKNFNMFRGERLERRKARLESLKAIVKQDKASIEERKENASSLQKLQQWFHSPVVNMQKALLENNGIMAAAADVSEGILFKIANGITRVVKFIGKALIYGVIILGILFGLYQVMKNANVAEKLREVWADLQEFFSIWILPPLIYMREGLEDILAGFRDGEFFMVIQGLFKILRATLEISFQILSAVFQLGLRLLKESILGIGAWLTAEGDSAKRTMAKILYVLAGITFLVAFFTGGWVIALAAVLMTVIGAFLDGMTFWANGGTTIGGLSVVGERGPELVELPIGSRVHSNAHSQKMLSAGGSNTNNITVQVQGRIGASDMEIREMADKVAREINLRMNRTGAAVTKFG